MLEPRSLSTVRADLPGAPETPSHGRKGDGYRRAAAGLLFGLAIVACALRPPAEAIGLGLVLAAFSALSWRWPRAPFLLVPVLLPLSDRATTTGQQFYDEWHLVLLVTLALSLWQRRNRSAEFALGAGFGGARWLVVGLWGSVLIATLVGLADMPTGQTASLVRLDAPQFVSASALSLILALALLPATASTLRHDEAARRLRARGRIFDVP